MLAEREGPGLGRLIRRIAMANAACTLCAAAALAQQCAVLYTVHKHAVTLE
jgi:hypothetical protein